MPLWKNKAFNITESEIRYAMEHTLNNAEAARFLNITYQTYKKYASMYVDSNTGKSLFELHLMINSKKAQKRTRIRSETNPYYQLAPMEDILNGLHPNYNKLKLKSRLIKEGYLEEKCYICGFNERRITDYQIPINLVWKNGNKFDHSLENLEFVCFNCYFLNYDDIHLKILKTAWRIKK